MFSAILNKSYAVSRVFSILMGVGIMILGSKFYIPLYPVPITLQTAGMLFIAMTFTPSNAFLSVFSWLMLCAAGLPVLAGPTGSIATLVGPMAGYLWGMLIAVTLMSACQSYAAPFFNQIFSQKHPIVATPLGMPAMIVVGYMGSFIVLSLGWLILSGYIGGEVAWNRGVAPFLLGDFLKITTVSGILSALKIGKKI